MATQGQTVALWAGDSLEISIAIKDNAGQPASLAGAIVRWSVGSSPSATGSDVLITKTSEAAGGVTIVGSVAKVKVLPADTKAMSASGRYFHEAEVTFLDGTVSTVATGQFVIHPTMSRPSVP